MKKAFKIIYGILKIIFIVFIIAFIFVVCLQRFSDNKISIMSYRMFSVLTGSMEPHYQVGDILISKEIKPSDIKVGDDVTYIGNEGTFRDKTVTHRVIKIEKDENGELIFNTKGTNNSIQDPVIRGNQILGKVIYKTIILSALFKIIATKTGMFILIIIPIMLIVISEIISTLLEKETKRRAK